MMVAARNRGWAGIPGRVLLVGDDRAAAPVTPVCVAPNPPSQAHDYLNLYSEAFKIPVMANLLQITQKKKGDVDVVYMAGRLDTNTSVMADTRLKELIGSGNQRILFNLSDLDYISSSGLRVLLVTLRKLRKNRGDLKLACLKPMVKEIIHLAGFDRIFMLYGTEEEALQSFVQINLDEKETRIMDVIASTIAIEEDRRRTEESLRQSENLYRAIFENTGTAMAIVDEDMTIFLVNEHFGKMVGYKKEELEEAKNLLSFVVRDDLGKVTEYHDQIGKNPADPPKHYEFRLKDREGKIKNIYMIQDIIHGTPRRVNSLIDITELRKIEEDLRHELTRKREFIILASHELRTPLQPLIISLQILAEDSGLFGMNAEALTMVKKCQQYVEREREMVELVIKLSEMGSSPEEVLPQVQPHPRKISPEELIRSHITMIRYSSQLELTIDIPKELVITTDSEYFYLIFESLVFYLISRSPVLAKIAITYRANGKSAEFSITNPSVHIPPEVIPDVFTPFQVGDESKLREKYGVIGMSLPLAKKMAELLGGTITVTSEPGAGTTFILLLPGE